MLSSKVTTRLSVHDVGAYKTGAKTRVSLARSYSGASIEGGEGVRQERARAVREQKRVEGKLEREEGRRRERTRERFD
jgi:hypothetical protein